ncbi:hypothetical protein [Nonomuraea insulae]|uniref:DUF5753 domain-containing protein n=1 Tax=Nonomuraea insulae TaxID=1616787 RepID=A0ABW1CUN1_9ACTN
MLTPVGLIWRGLMLVPVAVLDLSDESGNRVAFEEAVRQDNFLLYGQAMLRTSAQTALPLRASWRTPRESLRKGDA